MPRASTKSSLAPLAFVQPMECRPVKTLPTGKEWTYELKLDGYRCQAVKDADRFRLLSRNGKDLTKKFPSVAAAVSVALPIGTAVDGELVAFDKDGNPSFSAIQNSASGTYVMFFAFDLLRLAGQDVTEEPLSKRRQLLDGVFKPSELADISVQFPATPSFLESVRKVNGEGVVAKKLSSKYQAGLRTGSWMKMRLNCAQEFVVGGYTHGVEPFDALLLGVYRDVPRAKLPPSRR